DILQPLGEAAALRSGLCRHGLPHRHRSRVTVRSCSTVTTITTAAIPAAIPAIATSAVSAVSACATAHASIAAASTQSTGCPRPATGANRRAATSAAQAVQRIGNITGQGVFDRNHLLNEFRRHRNINLSEHLEHAFHVLAIIPQHEDLARIDPHNSVGKTSRRKRRQTLDIVGRLHIGRLDYRRHELAQLRELLRFLLAEWTSYLSRLSRGYHLHKLVPDVHDRNPIERQHSVKR